MNGKVTLKLKKLTKTTTIKVKYAGNATFNAVTKKSRSRSRSRGIAEGGRVGTFGWNTARHLVLYFAIPGTGRIMHTINIGYLAEQLIYTINHAADEAIFVDRSLLPLLSKCLTHRASCDCHGRRQTTEIPDGPRILDFEELVGTVAPIDFSGRVADERDSAALC